MIDKKLAQKSGALSEALRINMKKIDINNLTWKDPIANQIISDNSIIVKKLASDQRKKFMNPASEMLSDLPEIIQDQCHKFVSKYRKKNIYYLKYLLMTNNGKKKKKCLKKLLKAF